MCDTSEFVKFSSRLVRPFLDPPESRPIELTFGAVVRRIPVCLHTRGRIAEFDVVKDARLSSDQPVYPRMIWRTRTPRANEPEPPFFPDIPVAFDIRRSLIAWRGGG